MHTPRRRADLSAHPFWEEGIHGKNPIMSRQATWAFLMRSIPLVCKDWLLKVSSGPRTASTLPLAWHQRWIQQEPHSIVPHILASQSQNPKKLMGEMSPFYRWLFDLCCASSPGSCNSIEESLLKAWMVRLDGKWETPAGMEGWSFLSLWIQTYDHSGCMNLLWVVLLCGLKDISRVMKHVYQWPLQKRVLWRFIGQNFQR